MKLLNAALIYKQGKKKVAMPTHFSVHSNFHGRVGRVSMGPELASGGWGMAGGDASTGFGGGAWR
jgi:hypothetical protein